MAQARIQSMNVLISFQEYYFFPDKEIPVRHFFSAVERYCGLVLYSYEIMRFGLCIWWLEIEKKK